MAIERPSWDQYFMNIARDISLRCTCLCVRIGAVIIKDKRIVSSGYVGAPRKTKDCLERGKCLRRELGVPSGHRYELCRSVHAEQNAIINAARDGARINDGHLYIYGTKVYDGEESLIDIYPCFICKKMIINSGLKKVYAMTNKGIQVYKVKDWAEDWQKGDMFDDMDIYDAKYSK